MEALVVEKKKKEMEKTVMVEKEATVSKPSTALVQSLMPEMTNLAEASTCV